MNRFHKVSLSFFSLLLVVYTLMSFERLTIPNDHHLDISAHESILQSGNRNYQAHGTFNHSKPSPLDVFEPLWSLMQRKLSVDSKPISHSLREVSTSKDTVGSILEHSKLTLREDYENYTYWESGAEFARNVLNFGQLSSRSIYMNNPSGTIKLKWIHQALSVPPILWTDTNGTIKEIYATPRGRDGGLVLNFMSRKSSSNDVKWIEGSIRLQYDGENGKVASKSVRGIYFVGTGTIYMKSIETKNEKWVDLLRYIVDEDQFVLAQDLLWNKDVVTSSESLADSLNSNHYKIESNLEKSNLKQKVNSPGLSSCEFGIIVQTEDLSDKMSPSELQLIEEDESEPKGLSPKRLLKYQILGMGLSQNCNLTWKIEGQGLKFELIQRKALNYGLLMIVISLTEIFLTIRQVESTNTSSTISRGSLLCMGQQSMLDAYSCLFHLTAGVIMDSVFSMFAMVAFLKFILFSVFEIRYMLLIWKTRRHPSETEGDSRRQLMILYARFYGFLIAGLVILYGFHDQTLSWFIFILYSFWLPQIIHSVRTGATVPLKRDYLFGISLTRLFVPWYFFGHPQNFIISDTNYGFLTLLTGYVTLQTLILILQIRLGSNFMIPLALRPKKYDYFRPIPPSKLSFSDPELGSPDCVICMQPFEASQSETSFVITPCDHIFHADCLRNWLRIKLECPTCRTPLPEL